MSAPLCTWQSLAEELAVLGRELAAQQWSEVDRVLIRVAPGASLCLRSLQDHLTTVQTALSSRQALLHVQVERTDQCQVRTIFLQTVWLFDFAQELTPSGFY